jgi:DNA-binding protein H-NS
MNTENNADALFEMIKELSLEQVLAIKANVNEFSSSYQKRKIVEIIADLKSSIEKYGLDRADLLAEITESLSNEEVKQKKTGEPQYHNPANTSETWSGKGPQPKWLKDLCVDGKEKKDFLIKKTY